MDDIIPISSLIHEIRGVKVMLDRDLAALYQTTTSNLKRQARRNIIRFPDDFMFELSKKEYDSLRCQNGIIKPKRGEHSKYSSLVFTELGVAMLSSVLTSEVAAMANIRIMRAFVEARRLAGIATEMGHELAELKARVDLIQLENEQTLGAVNDLSEDVRAEIAAINDALNELSKRVEKKENKTDERRRIGFKRDS